MCVLFSSSPAIKLTSYTVKPRETSLPWFIPLWDGVEIRHVKEIYFIVICLALRDTSNRGNAKKKYITQQSLPHWEGVGTLCVCVCVYIFTVGPSSRSAWWHLWQLLWAGLASATASSRATLRTYFPRVNSTWEVCVLLGLQHGLLCSTNRTEVSLEHSGDVRIQCKKAWKQRWLCSLWKGISLFRSYCTFSSPSTIMLSLHAYTQACVCQSYN